MLWYTSGMHYVGGLLYIIIHPIDTTAATPFSAQFNCSAQGHGYRTITWYRNNHSLPNKAYSTLTLSVNMTTSILTIPNVTSEDVGEYYCVAQINMIILQSLNGNLVLAGKISVTLYELYIVRVFRPTYTTNSNNYS